MALPLVCQERDFNVKPLQENSLFPISLTSKMHVGGWFIIHYRIFEIL